MLTTSNVSLQFGSRYLFENINIKFSEGGRYGLIGANGSGKSTFMKILSGEISPSSGSVSKLPHERIAVLNQDQFAFEKCMVLDTVMMGHKELWRIREEKERLYEKMDAGEDLSEEEGMRLGDLEAEFAELDGYSAESLAGELLLGVGIPVDQHYGLMSEVAPGWKLRVLLVQALFANPDILLLDEPTNNLDIDTIQWLEDVLVSKKSTMIIISHDRHFLNTVCTHMADIDYGTIQLFPGNYDEYMFAAEQAKERLKNENAKKKAKIAELQNFVSRFSANASKAKQATSRQKQLDKIQLIEIKPSSRLRPFIRFEQDKKLFKQALIIKNLSKRYEDDDFLFQNVELAIKAGERVAVIGKNGIGKTTLLNCILEKIAFDQGEIKWAKNATVNYFKQDHSDDFTEDKNLYEWIYDWKQPQDDEERLRGILGRLLFSQQEIKKSVRVLSGGERCRMLFGKFMLQKANVLIMDEPTNHLDMESIESLNLGLLNYSGTLIFVSHDREFVSSIATRIIEITETEVINFGGTYSEYVSHKQRLEKQKRKR
ncbi:MAG: ABC-F family ATPase [Myxococcota bacterium]|nr:ABC-F family ATPase [Myxococcota bacterium]